MNNRFAIFDLDGTLVDSSPGIYQSFVHACQSQGLSPPEYKRFRKEIGPPIQKIARSLFPSIHIDSLNAIRSAFREDYDTYGYKNLSWYPNVADTLRELIAWPGLTCLVVTNKPTYPASQIIEAAGLAPCISRVIGIDYLRLYFDGPVFSSKKDSLAYSLKLFGTSAENAIYFGDTIGDMKACERLMIPFVAVTYGFYEWKEHELPEESISCFPESIRYVH